MRFQAHGWDNISIKMIKICGESVSVPLKIILEQSLKKKEISRIMENNKYSSSTQKRGQKPNKKLLPSQLTPNL